MLPQGFISVEDARKLIQAHTNENPTVDIVRLATNADEYLNVGHNFTIFLAEKANGKTVGSGVTYVQVNTAAQKENLRQDIIDTVRRTRGINLDLSKPKLKFQSTLVDPNKNPSGRLVADTESRVDYDTPMGAGLVG